MPQFVILTHDHPFPHWDFMLEDEGKLLTWRILEQPAMNQRLPAEPLPNHRIDYLEYEGPLSGDRGCVTQWDCGTFEWIHNEERSKDIRLIGGKLAGRARIVAVTAGWVLVIEED
ncbi:DNA polymerase ligase N-terminal domain-containing protein [Calycomorphotria hydatis]|uniref:DNA ligase-like protein n=1 Tax=Calycomorphotria hydatis TaxID=2528027 RepID=A0A517TCJ4_9PLAN|nr:DNA polymerase ligase N-terminal domain-containing protein [Calycomorphotria hydatis]QDT66086.1 Putative DNA ligase-like protein [Calycomorphotria hydatis]